MPVQYEDERIRDEFEDPANPLKISDALQRLLVRTKFRHWEYEEEYRVFLNLKDTFDDGTHKFVPFDQDIRLREVIAGPRYSLHLRRLRKLTQDRYPGVAVFKARLAFKFFKVVPDARTVRSMTSD